MSGHSKWAQIKRQKGAADIKRGEAFTKLANAISIAVREGGGITDPEANFRLRLAIEKAKQANMPKENIQRAIDRGRGAEKGAVLEDIIYEGFGPGGIAILIEVITDSRQRTYNEIKNILEKNGGRLAGSGATSFLFNQVGLVTVSKEGRSFDDLMMMAADSGALDVEEAGDVFEVYTKPEDLNTVKLNLGRRGAVILEAELFRKPNTDVTIYDKETAHRIMNLMNLLEECGDVHRVYANFDIDPGIL